MHGILLDLDARPSITGNPLPPGPAPADRHRLQLAATAFEYSSAAVMVTDTRQHIQTVNPAFSRITDYSEQEVLGQTPRLLASGQHDSAFFTAMWHQLNADGHWQGEVCNRRKNGDTWSCWLTVNSICDHHGQVSHFVATLTDISSLKRSEARLDHQAHHDPLTGLPNRTLFENRLHKALLHSQESGSLGAVLFLDLDRFKHINDSLGHATGDQLLKGVAQRLKENLRDIDTVARLGGDEFVILLPGLLQPADAQNIAHKLLASFSAPLRVGEHERVIGISIGSSLFPDDSLDAATLIKNADVAMYRSKAGGRNRSERYTQDLSARIRERLTLEQQLRSALDRHELALHFQPRVRLYGQQLDGVEARLRWNHPQLGQLLPEHFMPLAEESGCLLQIADWALEAACRQAQQWHRQHRHFGTLSIRLYNAQIRQPGLPERILQLLSQHQLEPEHLQLQITEQCIAGQPEHTLNILHSLKRLGVQLAIDDFGTGHLSLSHLKRLPLDSLKIDRSFIRGLPQDPHDTGIIRAILALSRSLGLTVTADGVETPEQQQRLNAEGCEHIQGPLISHPLPPGEFSEKFLLTLLSDFSDGVPSHPPL